MHFTTRRIGAAYTVALATALLLACGDGSATAPNPTSIASVSITSPFDTIAVGDTVVLTARAANAAGAVLPGAQFTWSSSDTAVATVDQSGRLTTWRLGQVTITAAARVDGSPGAMSATRPILVSHLVKSVTLDRAAGTDTIGTGDTLRLVAAARDGLGATMPGAQFRWTLSDTSLATVDSTGLLTARAMGTVTVTATAVGPRDIVNRAVSTSTALKVRLDFASISAGNQHACGIARSGVAYCWGLQDWGRIGNGTDAGNATRPVRISSVDRFTVISAGLDHTCGITTTAELACWGSGAYGKLGDGAHGENFPPHRILLPRHFGPGGFTDVIAQNTHTCALTKAGDVYCTGSNYAHQLGVDTVTSVCGQDMPGTPFLESCTTTFVKMTGAPAFTKLFGLGGTTCGRTAAGATLCWGQNGGGAGVGYLDALATPTPILGGIEFTSVSGITNYACGLATTGAMYCWGGNQFGELGTGAAFINMTLAPVRAAASMTFTAMAAGGVAFRSHACGITASGDTYCWGADMDGVLGFPATETCGPQAVNGAGPCATQPTRVPNLPKLASIAVGGTFTCGLTPTGTAYCWGNAGGGQLGNGAASGTGVAPVRVIDTN